MAAKKSILLTTYHEAFLCRGGGEYEMLEVALNLRKLGFWTDVYSPYSRDLEHYDVVLHFSIQPSGLPLVEEARRAGKEVILCSGAIGSPPAIINAVTDALGIRDIAMPASPERVWRAARTA